MGSWVIECMTWVDFLMCSKWLAGPSVSYRPQHLWLLSGLPVCRSLLVGRSQAFAVSTGTEGAEAASWVRSVLFREGDVGSGICFPVPISGTHQQSLDSSKEKKKGTK